MIIASAARTVSVEMQWQQTPPHGVHAGVAALHRGRGEHGVVVVPLLNTAPVLGEDLELRTLQTCRTWRIYKFDTSRSTQRPFEAGLTNYAKHMGSQI